MTMELNSKALIVSLLSLILMTAGKYEANAQYIDDIQRVRTELYCDGEKLSDLQIGMLLEETGAATFAEWEKACHGFKVGRGLLIGFGTLTGAGLVTLGIGATGMLLEGVATGIGAIFILPFENAVGAGEDTGPEFHHSRFTGVAIAGLYATGAGIIGLAGGTAVFCINKKRLNRIVDACNKARRPAPVLTYGAQKHGIGIALIF